MIQRIQTLFLIVSIALLGVLFYFPLADIASGNEIYNFSIEGIFKGAEKVHNGLPITIFLAVIIILHLVVLFGYKNRIRQIRILVFTIILLVGLFGLFLFFAWSFLKSPTVSFKIPVAFPLVAAIFDYLAIRYIGSDEALVRSIDRLRP